MLKNIFALLLLFISIDGFKSTDSLNDEIICKDLDPDCPSRKIFCDHEAYRAVMILKCAKTCNACDEVNKMIEEMENEEENEGKQLPWTHGGGSNEKEIDEDNEESDNGGEESEATLKEVEEVSENTEEPEVTDIENIVEEEEVEEEPKKVEEEETLTEQSVEDNKESQPLTEVEEEEEEEIHELPVNKIKSYPFGQFNKYKQLPERMLTKQPRTTTPNPKSKTATELLKRIENENKRRCVDDATDCEERKNLCVDNKYGPIVKKVCRKTCGVCKPVGISSNTYMSLSSKSNKTKVRGSDFYAKWKESRKTTPKPVIITMKHMRNQTRSMNNNNNNKNTFARKTITKKVTSQTLPRDRNPYSNILSGRYGSRGAESTDASSTTTIVDKAIDCVAKQALCNHKGYKNLMERMCPKTCSATFAYSSL
uniref:ShKT domain-containing protein n=1 Tax=Strongyloides venezuelensis TaxID=75913 RepID=A0A0K0F4N1_STRVS